MNTDNFLKFKFDKRPVIPILVSMLTTQHSRLVGFADRKFAVLNVERR